MTRSAGGDWDKLQAIDRLLLFDGGGVNSPILNAVIRVRGTVTREWARRNFIAPIIAHPRFRSVADVKGNRFILLSDDEFDPNDHLSVADTSLTGAEFNRVLSIQLSQDRPLWHLYIYTDKSDVNDEHSQLFFRVHHCIGDGGALVRFFLRNVFSFVPNSKPQSPAGNVRKALHSTLVNSGALPSTFQRITRPIRDVYSYSWGVFVPDVPNSLNTSEINGSKRVASACDRSVSQLRAATRRVGMTINDILLSALSSTIAKIFPGDSMNIGIPKFNPTAGKAGELHNEASVFIMQLPLNSRTMIANTAACVRLMLDRKASIRVLLCSLLAKILGFLPAWICTMLWNRMTRRVSLAFTNVPGPPGKMACGDREIEDVQVVAAGLGECGTIVTAFSYLDSLRINLCVDTAIMKDPENFMQEFDKQLDKILLWIDQVAEE